MSEQKQVKDFLKDHAVKFTAICHKTQHSIVSIDYGDLVRPTFAYDDDYEVFQLVFKEQLDAERTKYQELLQLTEMMRGALAMYSNMRADGNQWIADEALSKYENAMEKMK